MEHSTNIISTKYINDLCYKDGDQWVFYPTMLNLFEDRKPPVFINEVYWPFIDPACPEYHKKHQHLMGGSGSGKSRFVATKYLLKAQQPQYFRLLYTRQTKTSIKGSVFQLFKDIILQYGWSHKFKVNETSYDIRCMTTGHLLMSAGLDDVGKLQSVADPTDIWIEEPVSPEARNNVSFKAYTELLRRLRTTLAETHICVTYNPINKNSFLYKKFFQTKVYADDLVAILHSTYRDNLFLPDEYRTMLENLIYQDEDEANIFTFGRWGDSESKHRYIRTYKPARHLKKVRFDKEGNVLKEDIEDYKDIAYIPSEPVDLIYDFNVVPYMPMLCSQSIWRTKWAYDWHTGKKVYKTVLQVRYFKEYALENPFNSAEIVTQRFVSEYIEPFGPVPIDYYGDPTGKYGIPGEGSSEKTSRYIAIANVLKTNNLWHNDSDKVYKRKIFLVDKRELAEDILAGKYDIEVVIDEKLCPNFVEDLTSTQEGVKGFDKAKDKNGVEHRGHYISCIQDHLCGKFRHLLKLRGTQGEGSTDND